MFSDRVTLITTFLLLGVFGACDGADPTTSRPSNYNRIVVENAIEDTTVATLSDTIAIDLLSYFIRSENQPLSYEVLPHDTVASVIDVILDGNDLTIIPLADGTAEVSVKARDQLQGFAEIQFRVNVRLDLCPPTEIASPYFMFAEGDVFDFGYHESMRDQLASGEHRWTGTVQWEIMEIGECLDRKTRSVSVSTTTDLIQERFLYTDPDAGWAVVDSFASAGLDIFTLSADAIQLGSYSQAALQWRFPDATIDTVESRGGATAPLHWDSINYTLRFVRDVGLIEYKRRKNRKRDSHTATMWIRNE